MSVYTRLHINSQGFGGIDKDFGPTFLCPKCGRTFKDDRKGMLTPINTTVKYNQRVDHKCPYCDAVIRLYVAATKTDKGKSALQTSVNPIEPDWLEKEISARAIV